MNRLAAFFLMTLLCVPALAQQQQQQQPPQRLSVERELLEIEQEVDKALLREALLLQGRTRMSGTPEPSATTEAIEKFIAMKKKAIVERATESMKSRMGARPVTTPTPTPTPTAEAQAEESARREAAIEKLENSQIEARVLQTQVNLLENPMAKAVEELAAAELAASLDETQRAKVDEARKTYDKLKAQYVHLSKRLQMEQQDLQSLQRMSGMGGGFR